VKPYYDDEDTTLYLGDCLAVLPSLPDSSIDAVVTDPPYGLEFMGREWDGANGFRRSLNDADAGRDSVFGRTSRTSPEYKTGKPSGARIRQASEADQTSSRAHNATTSLVARNAPEAYVAGSVFQQWCEAWARECLRVLKPGGYLLAFGGTRTYHRMVCGVEDAGFEIRDSLHWIYGSGFPKHKACLKPAHEPIVMARKPGERSNPLPGLDACRTAAGQDYRDKCASVVGLDSNRNGDAYGEWTGAREDSAHDAGRWPPNILLDEEAAAEMDRQSGVTSEKPRVLQRNGERQMDGWGLKAQSQGIVHGDSGGASRFFPVFRYEAKAAADERPKLADGTAWPTVKPLDLMRWLVRLVTPTGGLVADLFAGTGTTGEACIIEGFPSLLIERDPVAAELIKLRLSKPIQPVLFGGEAS
jgi:site-specific DNA-methyltransferase (adenine-specific)